MSGKFVATAAVIFAAAFGWSFGAASASRFAPLRVRVDGADFWTVAVLSVACVVVCALWAASKAGPE